MSAQEQRSLTVEGGCLCGAVRYHASGPPSGITICHCATCRRASGAPLVAWSGFPAAGFSFTRGVPARYPSSSGVERSFCSRCGTQLTYRRDDAPDTLDLTLGSLDDPEALVPQDHTWTTSRLSWIALNDRLPAYPGNRTTP
ncbi:MAG: GFA family protein [Candidatus Binataceae bacterium]